MDCSTPGFPLLPLGKLSPEICPSSCLLSSVQFSSVAHSCPTLCDPMDCSTQASLSITSSQSLPKLMSIESVMASNHLIVLCRPLLRPPSIFPSIRVFSNESALVMPSNHLIFCHPLHLLLSLLLTLCIKQITSENLLCSSGNSAWCSVVTKMGRKSKRENACSLCSGN